MSIWWSYGFFKVQSLSRNIFHSVWCICLEITNWYFSAGCLKGPGLLYICIYWFMSSLGGESAPQWSLCKHIYVSIPSVQREGHWLHLLQRLISLQRMPVLNTSDWVESETRSHLVWNKHSQRAGIYMQGSWLTLVYLKSSVWSIAIWVNVARWHLDFLGIRDWNLRLKISKHLCSYQIFLSFFLSLISFLQVILF